MLRKWKRFGAFLVAVTAIVAAVALGAREESIGVLGVLARVGFIGLLAYLLTFAIWPRRRGADAARSAPSVTVERPVKPEIDRRPVAIIQSRPAGSRPGSRVHIPESPTARNSRGRRLDTRQPTRDFRWPAQK